jgi:phosphoglycolate phosphatase-like HAD superfamily hydrolase
LTDFIVVNAERLVNRNNIIFDIDGVLIDCSERLERCEEESNGDRKAFWSCFLSPRYMHLDKPIEFGFEVLRDRIANGFNVVIVTGRTDNMASETLEQLESQGITDIPVVFRKTGNLAKDYMYKLSVAKRLGLDVREVHDDSVDVLKSFGEVYPHAKLYLYILQ